MKNVIKLVLTLSLLAASSAFAASALETAYVESYRGRTDVPVPLVVVSPELGTVYAGTSVTLEFTVDESGKAKAISAPSTADAELVSRLTDAVAKWTFAPVVRDGKAVSTKVVLPFRIVDED